MSDEQRSGQNDSDLRQLLEQVINNIELLRRKFSDLISEIELRLDKSDLQVTEVRAIFEIFDRIDSAMHDLPSTDDATAQFMGRFFSIVSGGQLTPIICSLPFHQNPPHLIYRAGRVCQSNPSHVFCRNHNFQNCIICGGNI